MVCLLLHKKYKIGRFKMAKQKYAFREIANTFFVRQPHVSFCKNLPRNTNLIHFHNILEIYIFGKNTCNLKMYVGDITNIEVVF